MRITCPTCSAQYDVDENDISFSGQEVQCSDCLTVWTQTRSGEVSGTRVATALADGSDIAENVEVSEFEDLGIEDEDTNSETTAEEYEWADIESITNPPEDDEDETEEPDIEEPTLVDADNYTSDPEEVAEETTSAEISEGEDDDTNVWDKIDALVNDASGEPEQSKEPDTTIEEYSPPDAIPPIQSTPETAGAPLEAFDDDEHPWEAPAQEEEEFSDFVWSDPDADEPEEETEEASAPVHPGDELTQFVDTTDDSLEEIDDFELSAALNEQMAIEDELEKQPAADDRDILGTPEQLGGPRTRAPNLDALKSSVRSKSVELTSDEKEVLKPARRFRRGFTLTLLFFTILGAIYITRGLISDAVPTLEPYLESYARFVDTLRVQAEIFAGKVVVLSMQGFDWFMAKISEILA